MILWARSPTVECFPCTDEIRVRFPTGPYLDSVFTMKDISYKGFNTSIKIVKDVRDFLSKNNLLVNLISKIPNPRYWYENLLFFHLKDKDHKNFELIYCGIIEQSDEYESLESIIKRLKIKETKVVFDGSTSISNSSYLVRWIVIKV